MKHKIKWLRPLGGMLAALTLTVSLFGVEAAAQEGVSAAQVEQSAQAAAGYLARQYHSSGYSAGDLATVQLLARSGVESAKPVVEEYLSLVQQELERYGGAVYQGYDEDYNPVVGGVSLVGTLGAAWLAGEEGMDQLSLQLIQAAEELGTPQLIASDSPYNLARSLWCAQQLDCSEQLRDRLAQGVMSYYNQEQQAFDYWGCSVDTNAVMALGLLSYTGQLEPLPQVENAMDFVGTLRQPDGSYWSDFEYSTDSNADSTGLALALLARQGLLEEAEETYLALVERYQVGETGAFGYQDNTTPNLMATSDALEGLLTYAALLESLEQSSSEESTPSQPAEPPSQEEETTPPASQPETAEGEASPQTGDDGLIWMAASLTALLAAAALGGFALKRAGEKKN